MKNIIYEHTETYNISDVGYKKLYIDITTYAIEYCINILNLYKFYTYTIKQVCPTMKGYDKYDVDFYALNNYQKREKEKAELFVEKWKVVGRHFEVKSEWFQTNNTNLKEQ